MHNFAIVGILLTFLLLLLGPSQVAYAASITVTTTDDDLNVDGDCSLREAIQAANTNTAVDACPAGDPAPTVDIISFSVTGTITLTSGQLTITDDLTIDGPGVADLTISGNNASRVLEVSVGATLDLRDVTVAAGFATFGGGIINVGTLTVTNTTFSMNSASQSGGAIFNNNGTLTVVSSTFAGNSAQYGGGIINVGTLTVTNTAFSTNSASQSGGAIYNQTGMLTVANSTFSASSAGHSGGAIFNNDSLTLTSSTFSENSAVLFGGAIHNNPGSLVVTDSTFSGNSAGIAGGAILNNGGTLAVTNSTFSGNSANDDGGGIYNNSGPAMVTITSSTFSGNSANGDGGGIFTWNGTLTVTDSTFSENPAGQSGGGIFNLGMLTVTNSIFSDNSALDGGGIVNSNGSLTVTGSTFSGNSATGPGGGIYSSGGLLTVTNSTFSGNNAFIGGGINGSGALNVTDSTFSANTASGEGGGIRNVVGTLTVINSTFSGNSAELGGGIVNDAAGTLTVINTTFSGNSALIAGGGGIANFATGILQNTIVANSPSGGNCSGAITDGGGNLQYPGMECGVTIASADPLLDPLGLQNNGGPTETIALQLGSPAIDMAVSCPPPTTDQRGVSRPQGAACDIGAYEVANTVPTADPGGPYLTAVNTSIQFDGSGSSDPDGDTLSYSWTADGGMLNDNTLITPTYTADAAAGIFDVCLTVNDGMVNSAETCTIVVVYDPSAGFVTGGGWIDSPAGAYTGDITLTGKATFGFVSKYKKGASVPSGNTEFQFQAAGMNFHSESYEWLVVTGSNFAKFKGTGTINGSLDPNGNAFKFMLWAGDDSPDTFHIRIWWEDTDSTEYDVYDNGTDQVIGGGSIVIHKSK